MILSTPGVIFVKEIVRPTQISLIRDWRAETSTICVIITPRGSIRKKTRRCCFVSVQRRAVVDTVPKSCHGGDAIHAIKIHVDMVAVLSG